MFAFMQRSREVTAMTAAEAVTRHAAGDIVLIDIRDPSELRHGKARGALNIPTANLWKYADPRSTTCQPELKQGKPIAVYCASGARSAEAKQKLQRLGHEQVHNIGGLVHWRRAGGAVD